MLGETNTYSTSTEPILMRSQTKTHANTSTFGSQGLRWRRVQYVFEMHDGPRFRPQSEFRIESWILGSFDTGARA
jgi:hypothetical protein